MGAICCRGATDEWISPVRERSRQLCQSACQSLDGYSKPSAKYAQALGIAQHLLSLDPLDEATYVSLVRLYSLIDDGTSARRIYRTAVDMLERELGVAPGEALRAAYELVQTEIAKDRSSVLTTRRTFPTVLGGVAPGMANSTTCLGSVPRADTHILAPASWAMPALANRGLPKSNSTGSRGKGIWLCSCSYEAEGRFLICPVTELLRSAALRPQLGSRPPVWLIRHFGRLLPELLVEHQ